MQRLLGFALMFSSLGLGLSLAACDDDGGSTCEGAECAADPLATCPTGYVRVEAGTFTMGSPATETGREADEAQHAVTLTRPFCMKVTEVTQGEFVDVSGYTPSSDTTCGATCPVEDVRWMEATSHCNALSKRDGLAECYTCSGNIDDFSLTCSAKGDPYACEGYRLPTEAEWEYAARAGTTTAFSNGDFVMTGFCESTTLAAIGWFCGNSDNRIHPVATKSANAWGLHDMAGNVLEWCHDDVADYAGAATDPVGTPLGGRAIRGGAYDQNPESCRAASRDVLEPGYAVQNQGFRPVRYVR